MFVTQAVRNNKQQHRKQPGNTKVHQFLNCCQPLPSRCAIAWELNGRSTRDVGFALHSTFESDRVNPNREFFKVAADQVSVILRLPTGRDVTPTSPDHEYQRAARRQEKKKSLTNDMKFRGSLGKFDQAVYQRILTLGNQKDTRIKWGRQDFSLNVTAGFARQMGISKNKNRYCTTNRKSKGQREKPVETNPHPTAP